MKKAVEAPIFNRFFLFPEPLQTGLFHGRECSPALSPETS
jgi:hypothetical protein